MTNQFQNDLLKSMALTILDNDTDSYRQHKASHFTAWQHPTCVHCQLKTKKE